MPEISRKQINKQRIRSQALKLIKATNQTTFPINLNMIVKYLGIYAVSTEKAGKLNLKVSAFIDINSKILVYNSNDSVVRQRFSVAHEIGHFVLNHKGVNESFNINSSTPIEKEANIFAGEILIPYPEIKADLKAATNFDLLSEKYQVSKEALGWRIESCGNLL